MVNVFARNNGVFSTWRASYCVRFFSSQPWLRSPERGILAVHRLATVATIGHLYVRISGRTGIEERHWADQGEDAVGMAVKACWQVLDQENLIVDDLDLLICSTTSPVSVTPSMACRVLNGLTDGHADATLQAFDINAACSGYLYALQSGHDYLQSRPNGRLNSFGIPAGR